MTNLDEVQQRILQFLLEEFHEDLAHNWTRWITMLLIREHDLSRKFMKCPNIDRERGRGHDRLIRDYFASTPLYTLQMFRRRFRMRRSLFERVCSTVTQSNVFFTQRHDAMGILGPSPIQKVTTALRMLAYDKSVDELDEYLRIAESTSLLCLKQFCSSVISEFGAEYLRAPTPDDMTRILCHSASRGFPGMLGSLDCMHWEWKNCPRAWAGQFSGRGGSATIILEVVATYDLWVWHAFFGVPGTNNDINVMDKSPLFADLLQGIAPTVRFTVNNHVHHMAYFLTDGIYPQWPVFMGTISNPSSEKRKLFARMQEAYRKDIERCFGVLQARWAILKNPARLWNRSTLHNVITTCIILHNMIVEDERDMEMLSTEWDSVSTVGARQQDQRDFRLPRLLETRRSMRNQTSYSLLQNNLVEHLWSLKGQES